MTPPIVYEIAHILAPKKFTVTGISAHPDFQKNAHRDLMLLLLLGTEAKEVETKEVDKSLGRDDRDEDHHHDGKGGGDSSFAA